MATRGRWVVRASVSLLAIAPTACSASQPVDAVWVMPGVDPPLSGTSPDTARDEVGDSLSPWAHSGPHAGGVDDPVSGQTTAAMGAANGAWWTDEADAFAEAQHSGRGVLIDFMASWCIGCRVFEERTFSNPQVQLEIAASFVPLQIDVTEQSERTTEQLNRYQVFHLPMVLIVDDQGRELDRFTAYVGPDELIARLHKAKARQSASHPTSHPTSQPASHPTSQSASKGPANSRERRPASEAQPAPKARTNSP